VNPYFAGGTVRILDILSIWNGGLGIPGAIIGGAVALYYYARQNKINFAEWADIGAPSLALGQAIGRFGNYFNQELYGAPTNLPWKLYIDPAHRLSGYENVEYFHPLFAYEAIFNLANMFFLIWVTRNFEDRLKKGDVFLTYLVFYPTVRFFLEFVRLDSSLVAGVNANQTVMAIVAVAAAAALIWRHRSSAPAASPRAGTSRSASKLTRQASASAPARKASATAKKSASKKSAPKKRAS
jgi:phosphatidylglycerol:prolipoprotein diacylglycerol transferase